MAAAGRIDQTTLGIILMVLAIFSLSSLDVIIKSLAATYDIWLLVWVRWAGQMVLATLLVLPRSRGVLKTDSLTLQVVRAALLFIGTFCFFFGLASIELASATALLQTNPLLIVIGSYLLLGESLNWKKLAGVIAGLVGALVIIRPGMGVFTVNALYPLAAAIGFSGYAVVTRFMSRNESVWTSFFYTTLFGTIFATIVFLFNLSAPMMKDLHLFVAAAVFGTIGQYLIIRALFLAQASVLAPYGYTSLIFAAGYGAIFFNEFPDIWIIAGALIIVASGLYVWRQQAEGNPLAQQTRVSRK